MLRIAELEPHIDIPSLLPWSPLSFRAGSKLSDSWQKSGYTVMPGCISIEPRKEEIDTDWYKSTIGERRRNMSDGQHLHIPRVIGRNPVKMPKQYKENR
jgi:hypothetical protein